MIDYKNSNNITSAKCIGSAKEIIPLILFVFRLNILYNWYKYNNLDGDVVIAIIETGYANDDIILEWLQHFIDNI